MLDRCSRSIDWRKSVCWWRRPRSSTMHARASVPPRGTARPAGRPRSSRRSPDPTMQTSTRSAIVISYGRLPLAVALARQLAPVRVVGVAVRRRARVAHHLIAGSGVDRRVALRGRGDEGRERRPRSPPPTPGCSGCAGSSPSTQTATRFANGRSRNCPPRGSERVSQLGQERGSSASNPISGLWKSSSASVCDGAGLVVRAGDRLRVDLVAEVGAAGPCGPGSACPRPPAASRRRG